MIPDLAVGTWMNYAVAVLSGSTGNVIWTDPQTLPVHFVESVDGPDTGDIAVIATLILLLSYTPIADCGLTSRILLMTLVSFICCDTRRKKITAHSLRANRLLI